MKDFGLAGRQRGVWLCQAPFLIFSSWDIDFHFAWSCNTKISSFVPFFYLLKWKTPFFLKYSMCTKKSKVQYLCDLFLINYKLLHKLSKIWVLEKVAVATKTRLTNRVWNLYCMAWESMEFKIKFKINSAKYFEFQWVKLPWYVVWYRLQIWEKLVDPFAFVYSVC